MSSSRVATPVGRLLERGTWTGQPDARLLDRYARLGDPEAFEALASRHGPMVLGVCRRILAEPSDVDDAFQATFLVLIRRASSLGPGDVLSAWLHGVATKVARRARMDRARRRARERDGLGVEPRHEPTRPDFALREVIDEEVERLPWKYRAPVALCYLEGLTHEEAADRLGWPVGSLKGRLARARVLLGSRLSRRGVTAGAGALALEGLASAAATDAQVSAVALAAGRVAAGVAWKSVLSCPVVKLAKGACAPMVATKLTVAALAASAMIAVAGVGVAAARSDAQEPSSPPPPVRQDPAPSPTAKVEAPAVTEALAPTPTPPSEAKPPAPPSRAERLRTAAKAAYQAAAADMKGDAGAVERVYRASRLWLDADTALATDEAARKAAFAGHRDRMRIVARANYPLQFAKGGPNAIEPDTNLVVAEAEFWASQGKTPPRPVVSTAVVPSGSSAGTGDSNPKTAAILEKLDEPLAMNFPNETPLEDVLKYISQATQTPGEFEIPIYVEPVGLSQADRTMTSPISIDLFGVPLRRTLQLMLKQLDLVYYVEDGILVITSKDAAEAGLGPDAARPSPLQVEMEKADRGELSLEEMEDLAQKLKLIAEIRKLREAEAGGQAQALAQ